MTREELLVRWRFRQQEWSRLEAQVSGRSICAEVIADLELLWKTEDEASLSLEEAATYSGYSSDHLRRLVREHGLPAYHQGRRLCFRAGDLPRKPALVDSAGDDGYDAEADARQVTAQRNHGGHHGTLTAA